MTRPKAKTADIIGNPTQRADLVTGSTIPKHVRYDWRPLNKPGEFVWINKDEIFIDKTYQRNPNSETAITRMAREWDWVSCGALIVCDREGKWYVVDGQHRLLAAQKRTDIKDLPCLVFESSSSKEEAKAFIGINTNRFKVNSFSRFNANLTAGDPICTFVKSLLATTGHAIGPSGSCKTVACVSTLYHLAAEDRTRLTQMWPLIVAMHPDTEVFSYVVKGLWAVETMQQNTTNGKASVTREPQFSKLIRLGGETCLVEIRRQSVKLGGKGGQAVFRDGILNALKKKI